MNRTLAFADAASYTGIRYGKLLCAAGHAVISGGNPLRESRHTLVGIEFFLVRRYFFYDICKDRLRLSFSFSDVIPVGHIKIGDPVVHHLDRKGGVRRFSQSRQPLFRFLADVPRTRTVCADKENIVVSGEVHLQLRQKINDDFRKTAEVGGNHQPKAFTALQ